MDKGGRGQRGGARGPAGCGVPERTRVARSGRAGRDRRGPVVRGSGGHQREARLAAWRAGPHAHAHARGREAGLCPRVAQGLEPCVPPGAQQVQRAPAPHACACSSCACRTPAAPPAAPHAPPRSWPRAPRTPAHGTPPSPAPSAPSPAPCAPRASPPACARAHGRAGMGMRGVHCAGCAGRLWRLRARMAQPPACTAPLLLGRPLCSLLAQGRGGCLLRVGDLCGWRPMWALDEFVAGLATQRTHLLGLWLGLRGRHLDEQQAGSAASLRTS